MTGSLLLVIGLPHLNRITDTLPRHREVGLDTMNMTEEIGKVARITRDIREIGERLRVKQRFIVFYSNL